MENFKGERTNGEVRATAIVRILPDDFSNSLEGHFKNSFISNFNKITVKFE